MSQENVKIVRDAYDAYVRGDLNGAFAALDPAIEIYDHDLPEAGEYRGLEDMVARQAEWESSWESWRWAPVEEVSRQHPRRPRERPPRNVVYIRRRGWRQAH